MTHVKYPYLNFIVCLPVIILNGVFEFQIIEVYTRNKGPCSARITRQVSVHRFFRV